ncbi:hypothetical protein EKO27_g8888 [Xylaria grammica]|uniref:Uncharacterized protein n=1 Tax=Xylaria grammica TaxID=363999 RepID=A0A439CVK9_9PEZI|nr:hypothetical protein EKO27_g8888 [Xylaria grammica]
MPVLEMVAEGNVSQPYELFRGAYDRRVRKRESSSDGATTLLGMGYETLRELEFFHIKGGPTEPEHRKKDEHVMKELEVKEKSKRMRSCPARFEWIRRASYMTNEELGF